MAKRRKEKDEEEDKPFKIPKFDEEAFLKRERRNIKATFISFLFGILMALVCFGFWALMGKNDLKEMDAGIMDPAGRGLTNAGRICGMIAVIIQCVALGIWLLLAIVAAIAAA